MMKHVLLGLLFASGAACSDFKAEPVRNESATTDAVAFRPDGSQLCNDRAGPNREPSYPGGFLVVWAPYPHSPKAEISYAPSSLPEATKLYERYSKIADSSSTPTIYEEDVRTLRRSFDSAIDLIRDVAKANLERRTPKAFDVEYGIALEDRGPELAVHLAYIILTIDEDYGSFARRVRQVLQASNPQSIPRKLLDGGFGRETRRSFPNISPSQGFLRGMIVYLLLEGKNDVAEQAMLTLLASQAGPSRQDYYYPYSAEKLAEVLRRGPASLDEIVYSAPTAPRLDYCSDLYALYIEWLDLRSRAAVARGQAGSISRTMASARRLRESVSPDLLGPRYARALNLIISRLDPARGNSTQSSVKGKA